VEGYALVIIVIGKADAKPEARDEVLALSLDHVKRSRTEPGCIEHNVSVDPDNDIKFIFVEYWSNMPALLAHFALDTSKDFVAALTPLLTQRPDMKIYRAEEIIDGD